MTISTGLRRAVESFTPEYVGKRAGLARGQLRQAAELFAHNAKRGAAIAGTGPDMAQHSNLAEHLIECLNVVCGRYLREGERVPNPGVLMPRQPRRARVIAPRRSWESGHKSRIRGVGMLFGEMMAGIMADEILVPGKGQIKAIIVDGGNPVNSLPDQRKTVQALSSLELLVTIDPVMSNTAKLSHYILPPSCSTNAPTSRPRGITKRFSSTCHSRNALLACPSRRPVQKWRMTGICFGRWPDVWAGRSCMMACRWI